jgi:5-hydroxyisourate hydrolase-like protein (transthyretin family)
MLSCLNFTYCFLNQAWFLSSKNLSSLFMPLLYRHFNINQKSMAYDVPLLLIR